MKNYILFDHDGVLVDTESWYHKAVERALAHIGLTLDRDQYDRDMNQGLGMWGQARAAGVDERAISRLREARNDYYQEYLRTEAIEIDGVAEALAELSKYARMAIVTTSKRADFDVIHEKRSIRQFMDFVLVRDDYTLAKPHPEPYLTGLKRFGAAKEETLVVEDSPRGLASAVAAGIDCAIVYNDFMKAHDFSQASYRIETLIELKDIILNANASALLGCRWWWRLGSGFMDAVQFGPAEDLGYRRPPVTASFEDLRRRGLPDVLFVNSLLPEGVTICDVTVFAAMIEEACSPPGTLILDPPDENGNQRCRGAGINSRIFEWAVVTPGRRSGWRMTLAPERDGRRQATIEALAIEHHREVTGATLATFPVSSRPAGDPPAVSPVQFGPPDTMGYRRPPVTVSFDDLSQRGLPRALFVNRNLPEGVTICDVTVFAAMIKQAYQDGSLRFVRPDEHGNDQCVGLGGTGIWEWQVVRPVKPIAGERYPSLREGILRILIAPEKDGKRACTVDLNGYPAHEPEDDSPVTFTIWTRAVSLGLLERGLAAGDDPADVAEGVDMALSWLTDASPAAAGLLRLLAVLPPAPVPLLNLLLAGGAAVLPGPQAAALIGPLLGSPAAVDGPMTLLNANSVTSPVIRAGHQLHPLARAAVRAQLTADESAHWEQAAAALVEAAAAADPNILGPYARSVLDPGSGGPGPGGPGTRGRRRIPGGWGPASPDQ